MERFDKFANKVAQEHPLAYLIIFGFWGMAIIITVLDGMLYLIGGNRLVDSLNTVTILCGVGWMMVCWFKVRPYISK